MRKAKVLVQQGEEELYQGMHFKPLKCKSYRLRQFETTKVPFPHLHKLDNYQPGGICYERYYEYGDWHVDYWHPMEKAMYPKYFAKREQAKLDYVKMWETRYGKPAVVDAGVTEHRDYLEEPETDDQKKYGPFSTPVPGAPKHH